MAERHRAGRDQHEEQIASQIVLTFDDGPHAYFSNAMIDALKELRCPASFFVLGSKAKSNAATLQRMARAGFEIGVHGWIHHDWSTLTRADLVEELSRTINVVEDATGRAVKFYRPPYGILPVRLARACENLSLTAIGWNVSSFDWSGLSSDEIIVEIALSPLRDKIVLLHDGYGNPAATLDFVCWFLPVCQKAGIRVTSLETYLAQRLKDGRNYVFDVPMNGPALPLYKGNFPADDPQIL
jgi:peptidoglycan/xylan/chitin deacetylase (PgdA/CDA1 family)